MTFKWSVGCDCCDGPVPCCVLAKRHFMDTLGFTQLRLSNGPSGGPYNTYQSLCFDTSTMSTEVLPAFSLAGPYTESIIRNDSDCLFRRSVNQCAPSSSYIGDAWNVGATSSCSVVFGSEYLGISAFSPGDGCTQTNDSGGGPFSVDPVVYMTGTISFYCEGGVYKYRLELTTLWTYAATSGYDFADDFPTTDGADYTASGFSYTRNDGNAFAGVGSGSFGVTTYAYNPTTSLTQWAPGIDFTGISEQGLLELI